MVVNEGPALPAVPVHAAANLRKSMLLALPVAVVAVVILWLFGHPLAGLFVIVGLGLGAVNSALVQRSVVGYAGSSATHRKQRFVGGVFVRLGAITLVALALVLTVRPDGLGVLGGLAIFQLLMVGNASMPLIKELRKA